MEHKRTRRSFLRAGATGAVAAALARSEIVSFNEATKSCVKDDVELDEGSRERHPDE